MTNSVKRAKSKGKIKIPHLADKALQQLIQEMRQEVRKRGIPTPVKKRGCPTKLTPDLIAQVAFMIRRGVDVDQAVYAAGVSRSSYYRWLEEAQGERPPPMMLLFLDAIDQARGELQALLASSASIGALKDPRVALQMLAVRFPGTWGGGASRTVDVNFTSTKGRAAVEPPTPPPPGPGAGTLRIYLPAKDQESDDEELPDDEAAEDLDL